MKDKGFKTNEFDDSLKYAKSFNVDGLFDKYDGEEFKPKSEWNREESLAQSTSTDSPMPLLRSCSISFCIASLKFVK